MIYRLLVVVNFLISREEEIRTLDTVTRIHTFQACSFNHSDTSLFGNVGAKIAFSPL